MTRLLPSLALAACFAAVACAPTSETVASGEAAAAGSARQCFVPSLVRNFRSDGSSRVYLRAERERVFALNTSGGCHDLDFAHSLAISPDGAAMAANHVCTGDWVRITLSGSNPSLGACRALVDRALTAEEVAALPSAHRP